MFDLPTDGLRKWQTYQVVLATLAVVIILTTFWLLWRFHNILFLAFIAIVISTAIRPLVEWQHRRGTSRATAVILVYLGLLVLLAASIWLLVPRLIVQFSSIALRVPEGYEQIREAMLAQSNLLLVRLGQALPARLPLASEAAESVTPLEAVRQSLVYGQLALQTAFALLATLVLAFYWTLEGPRLTLGLTLLLPQEKRESFRELLSTMEDKVGRFVVGQAALSLAVGVLALIAYLIIGVPDALLLAVVAGVLEVVPILGPAISAVIAILVAVSANPTQVVGVIIASAVIQQLENSFLVPRIMNKAVGVNPLLAILALVAFGSLLGVTGALMAIPLAAIIQVLLNRYLLDPETDQDEDNVNRGHLGRLRYLTRELIEDVHKQSRNDDGDIGDRGDRIEEAIEGIAQDLDVLLVEAANSESST